MVLVSASLVACAGGPGPSPDAGVDGGSAGGGALDGGATDAAEGEDASVVDAGSGSLVLGEGFEGFVPFVDPVEMAVHAGFQGGHHIFLSTCFVDVPVGELTLRAALYRTSDETRVARSEYRVRDQDRLDVDAGSCFIGAIVVFEGVSGPAQVGQDVRLEVEVTHADGPTYRAEQLGTLVTAP